MFWSRPRSVGSRQLLTTEVTSLMILVIQSLIQTTRVYRSLSGPNVIPCGMLPEMPGSYPRFRRYRFYGRLQGTLTWHPKLSYFYFFVSGYLISGYFFGKMWVIHSADVPDAKLAQILCCHFIIVVNASAMLARITVLVAVPCCLIDRPTSGAFLAGILWIDFQDCSPAHGSLIGCFHLQAVKRPGT